MSTPKDYGRKINQQARHFGILIAVIIAVCGYQFFGTTLVKHLLWIAAASLFLLLALFNPRLLHGVTEKWLKFGVLISKIVSPVIWYTIFLVFFIPASIFMKLCKRDRLSISLKSTKKSYWNEASGACDFGKQFL